MEVGHGNETQELHKFESSAKRRRNKRVSDVLFLLLFADDSNLFLSGKCPERLIEQMNNEMKKIIDWLNINKLSLNVKM